jgi:hypothetical protein
LQTLAPDDPENYFSELASALENFKLEMVEHPDALDKIDAALADIKRAIEELNSERPQEPDSDDFYGGSSPGRGNGCSRSIFDDVDE